MTELLLIFTGLFTVVWIIFKLASRHNNPFKNAFFWATILLSSAGLAFFMFYWFTRNFFGPAPEDGWNRRYYENGKIQTEFFANAGRMHGYYKSYFPSGQLQLLYKYENGIQVDTAYTFYETGDTLSIEIFNDDRSVSEIIYSPSGLKTSESYQPMDTTQDNYNITYYPNGNKEVETRINAITFEGSRVYYYPNGQVKYQGQYKNGNKDGVWIYCDSLPGIIIDRDTFDFKSDRDFKAEW